MAKKSGFLAQMNRQIQAEARRREQAAKQAAREQEAAERRAEKAARDSERAQAQADKAAAAGAKEAEREAKRLHDEAMEADVAARNATLAKQYEEIDGILAATLEVDDYVDLESLRQTVEHPVFEPGQLAFPAPAPAPLAPPPEPQFMPPDGAPKGLSGVLGGKKKYNELLTQAQSEFALAHDAWEAEVAALPARQAELTAQYEAAERARGEELATARADYEAECARREQEVGDANSELDQLIANLGYEVEDAIQEYVAIVLGNSIYPDSFPVEHDFEFDSSVRELALRVSLPPPSDLPSTKAFRYVKSKGEVADTSLPQKVQKERYAGAVAQVALRTLHEIFEADRAERIQTITLVVVVEAIDVATGQLTETPLVAVASDRATFEQIDLGNVVPLATLQHLNALVSKNPWGLVAIDRSKGVRG